MWTIFNSTIWAATNSQITYNIPEFIKNKVQLIIYCWTTRHTLNYKLKMNKTKQKTITHTHATFPFGFFGWAEMYTKTKQKKVSNHPYKHPFTNTSIQI